MTYDVAVIGAGTAGLAARGAAAQAGARTVLIEQGPGGTTCARVGCMPSKLLIAAAAALHGTTRLGLFGLRLEGRVAVDGRAVMERLRRERDGFVRGVDETVERIPAEERLRGTARFLSDTSLSVSDETEVEARAIVIATGSRSTLPESLSDLGELVLTNESVFELADLPASLAVVGAGPLGIELAQAFNRLGVRVAVFDKGAAVGGLADPVVGAAARDLLGREIDLRLGTTIEAERASGGVMVRWSGESSGAEVFARVLVAAGRPPDLAALELDRTSLERDAHGTPVFDRATMRCGTSSIFLAGDADADRPVLHEAAEEGRIAGANAARCPDVRPSPRDAALAITYTDPELAVVGGGWMAVGSGEPAVGEADMAESGRARIMGVNAGRLRVYARKSDGVLLGGELCVPGAEHLAHLLAWAVQGGLTAEAMLALPVYHPTLEESLRSAVRQICSAVRSRPERRSGELEFGPSG